jgi:YfiH family protein
MSICVVKTGTLEYLTAEGIRAPHCFTTRLGGVSKGYLSSMNLGYHRGDSPENVEKNYEILANAIGFSTKQMVLANQVHSDIVRTVGLADARGVDHRAYPECDALITNTPGVALVVFTADCTPILLHDPVTGAVGAVHAGWRGTAAGIAGKAVEKMQKDFGCDPASIRAAIGPNIAQCCFETDGDVPEAMVQTFGREAEAFIRKQNEKYYVNLKEINALSLRRRGVRHVEISESCTMCEHHRFWSHRYTRGLRGSQGALIRRKEVWE